MRQPARRGGIPAREEVERADQLRERVERVTTRQVVHGAGALLTGLLVPVVGDVLADARLAAAVQRDDGRAPCEVARDVALERRELVALDLEREPGEHVVGAVHREAITAAKAT